MDGNLLNFAPGYGVTGAGAGGVVVCGARGVAGTGVAGGIISGDGSVSVTVGNTGGLFPLLLSKR